MKKYNPLELLRCVKCRWHGQAHEAHIQHPTVPEYQGQSNAEYTTSVACPHCGSANDLVNK